MPDFRLAISDGVTQLDLYGGTGSICREAGLSMPAPKLDSDYLSSPYRDGDRLSFSRYGNRIITIDTKITGSSLAELRDNVRTIQRVLNDAEDRVLLGQGTAYYLEMQWGNTAGSSTFFDILRGDLKMPDGYVNHYLKNDFLIPSAKLELTCKPFGRGGTVALAQTTAINGQSVYRIMDSYQFEDLNLPMNLQATTRLLGQTFIPSSSYTSQIGGFKMYRDPAQSFGSVVVSIYNTTGGTPVLPALTIGTANPASCGTASTQTDWVLASYPPILLGNGTMYAIIANATITGDPGYVRCGTTLPLYTSGSAVYSNTGGSTWYQNGTVDCSFAVYGGASGQQNYQNITTNASFGDVPTKMYMKITPILASGTAKVWIAKRSGLRQADDLWFDGIEGTQSRITTIGEIGGFQSLTSGYNSDSSYRLMLHAGTTTIGAGSAIAKTSYTITTIPKGYYKVLAQSQCIPYAGTATTTAVRNAVGLGLGWTYGSHSQTPLSSGDYVGSTAISTWEILDLGDLKIPPVAESDVALNNTLQLDVFTGTRLPLPATGSFKVDINHLFLCPIDEGLVNINSVKPTDTIVIDGLSDNENVYLTSGGTVTAIPDYIGKPFTIGRENTRIYMVRNDGTAMNFTSDIIYRPNFLII